MMDKSLQYLCGEASCLLLFLAMEPSRDLSNQLKEKIAEIIEHLNGEDNND